MNLNPVDDLNSFQTLRHQGYKSLLWLYISCIKLHISRSNMRKKLIEITLSSREIPIKI